MAGQPIKTILLVEDNPGDARLLREMFNDQGARNTELISVARMSEAEAYLAGYAVDLVILDLGLPDAQGIGALRRVRAAAPHVSVVVLTGLDDEAIATEALQEGAQDYLVKGEVEKRGLLRSLRYAIERKAMEQAAQTMALQMAHQAEHDLLTGLPNRMLLSDRIGQAIAAAPRHGNKVAVLFLDLDGFKHINDSLGHSTGDKLLRSVATRLTDCVRLSDTVSRQGGDEFVVLLSEVEQSEDVVTIVRKVVRAVADAHVIDQHDRHVTTSIGVSVYPDDGLDAETLIKNADTAMYQAKEKGAQSYQFFRPAMNVRAVERQSIEESLRRALERQEFALHYQPKVDFQTGAITGSEALIRWTHPTRGPISPAQFISVAEACGLIVPIGAWVLREACAQARAWADAGLPASTMAVNVSAVEFQNENFLENLFTTLRETGLDPRSLELELTESVLMKRAEVAASILQSVRKEGVQVALDDFGTGFSSLSYLQRFPVDTLKIDQSFVRQISTVGGHTSIVSAVIAMARSLNLVVVAEGVETPDEVAFLRAHHCDQAQGYYFSRPVPPEQFGRLLENGIAEATCLSRAVPRIPNARGGGVPRSSYPVSR